ncbi:MAG: tryptophan 7-halogenase [Pleurocapsa sp. MO_226.B13]|nr:tryptophan 7-halogenase [Pleurocapsa sp. MO_226.B13]
MMYHNNNSAKKIHKANLSANEESQIREFDVAVIGAGPLGILYASWLKQARPHLRILMLDRNPSPKHKIGESTLSGFCKSLRSVGISHEVMQRLFFPKNGLGFFYGDKTNKDITKAPEYILETFDETFQVERRVLDSLLIANGRRLGIEIIQNARIEPQKSVFSSQGNFLTYHLGSDKHQIRAQLVADASGASSVLGRHFGLYATTGLTFQTGAVWAYFKKIRRLDKYQGWKAKAQCSRDEYTQHICFPEGWMWYIPLKSWQQASDRNLAKMLTRLLTTKDKLPNQQQLSQEFGCPTTDIFSIGIVLREDRDRLLKQGGNAVFEYYQQQVPIIAQILEGAEILRDYYENHSPYEIRRQIRHYSQQIAGDGWLLLGDAAFFVDPLISPGLTGGAATAYFAFQETLKAFDCQDFSQDSFIGYQNFTKTLHQALERDNQLVYMSFNHPEALKLIQRFQEIYARRHFHRHQQQSYSLADTNVWGILDEKYREMQTILWQIMRQEELRVSSQIPLPEQMPVHYERMVKRLQQCLTGYVNHYVKLTPYITQNKRINHM